MPEFSRYLSAMLDRAARCAKCTRIALLLSKLKAGPSGFDQGNSSAEVAVASHQVVIPRPHELRTGGWLFRRLRPRGRPGEEQPGLFRVVGFLR